MTETPKENPYFVPRDRDKSDPEIVAPSEKDLGLELTPEQKATGNAVYDYVDMIRNKPVPSEEEPKINQAYNEGE